MQCYDMSNDQFEQRTAQIACCPFYVTQLIEQGLDDFQFFGCNCAGVTKCFRQACQTARDVAAKESLWFCCDDARRDVFEYIELFYNPKRKHTNNGMLSPVDFEIRQQKLNTAGV